MKGSIELARLICVEIAGEPVPGDTDGDSYGSMEIAKILSAGYERLKAENEDLKKRIAGGVRVYAYQKDCDGEDWAVTTDAPGMDNATLLLDEQGGE